MRAAGRKEGVSYARWTIWPNTTHCSRLLMCAERHGLGDKLLGVLNEMCYEEGENVSLRQTVARAAVRAGVPGGEEYAMGDEGTDELMAALQGARVNGKRVSAAPTFNLRYAGQTLDFSGAQDYARWVSILESLLDEQ